MPMISLYDFVLIVGVSIFSWLGCLVLIKILASRGILDVPVERSSHSTPTPRGGGIMVVAAILLVGTSLHIVPPPILVLFAILAVIGWADDVYSLSPAPRFLAQVLAVGIALFLLPNLVEIFDFESKKQALQIQVIFAFWIWFTNLYNFMDGIDGITGVETISISLGVIAVALSSGTHDELILPAAIIAAATLGFLAVNWHPAKIFLGDVGSIPLGFLLGWLLLMLANSGALAAALILPMYYLADATITLLHRLWRKEKPWHAHKEHFYQRAHQGGLSHSSISTRVLGLNICLIILAVISANGYQVHALIGAALLTSGLLFHFGRYGKRAS